MTKSKEKDLPKFTELVNHFTELDSRQGVILSCSFNRHSEEMGEQRAKEHPCSSYFWARNLMNGSKHLFLNAKNPEFSNQSHPYLYIANVYFRTKYTQAMKALIKLSVIELMSSHFINELQQESNTQLYYLTLWGKLILFLNCFLQLNNSNCFCDS